MGLWDGSLCRTMPWLPLMEHFIMYFLESLMSKLNHCMDMSDEGVGLLFGVIWIV